MKNILCLILLLASSFGATITASGNASTNSATNWVGGVAPNCTSDTIATSTFTVTTPAGTSCTFGSSTSGVGIGVNVSAAGGKYVCAGATAVRFNGFDNTTNKPFDVVANATIDLSNCPFTVGQPSDLGATPRVLGNIITDLNTVGDTADALVWSTASGNNTYSNRVSNPLVNPPNIYVIKMENATQSDPGPISNSAGTGLGAFGNTSMHFTSGGFDSNGGTTHVEKDLSTFIGPPFVDITTLLTTNGDFGIDYAKGMLYYKSSSAQVTVVFDFKFGTWFGWSIIAQNNAANSAVTLDGTYSHMGSVVNGNAEFTGGGWMIGDKYVSGAAGADATRLLTIGTHLTFNYSSRPLQIYCQNITCADSTHHLVIQNITLHNNRYANGVFQGQGGMIHLGYMNFVDVKGPILNSAASLFDTLGRSNSLGQKNIIVTGAVGDGRSIGHVFTMTGVLPGLASNSKFTNSNIAGFENPDLLLQNMDGALVSICGNSTDGPNEYSYSTVLYAYRAGRLDEWCVVKNMDFGRTNHHGFVMAARSGYINCLNLTFDHNDTWGFLDAGNFPGGITTSYNQVQWLDNCTFDHGTYDGGTRTLEYNDGESSVTIVTRFRARNNIFSNSLLGMHLAAPSGSSNITNLGIIQEDGNDDYNNTTVSNVLQGTFMFGGVNYNISSYRAAVGAYVFSPSYTLPDVTNRSLVMTIAGSFNNNKTLTVAWGGGTPVSFIDTLHNGQGAITAFDGTQTCPVQNTAGNLKCPLITDSAATFATAGNGLQTYFLLFTSGACSGQTGGIYANTGTTLSVFSNTATGSFTACTPVATDTYVIIKRHQQLFDSGGTQSVFVQLYPPELNLTNATLTDNNITIQKNYPGTSGANNGVNPNFVANATGNLSVTNSALFHAGTDGLTVGAFPVTGSQVIGAAKMVGTSQAK